MTTGSLSVLNVGAGDIQVSFNQHDTDERERAIRMLKDMQARGYAILVQLPDGTYTRAVEIDAEHGRYVINMPFDPVALPPDAVPVAAGKRRRGRPRKERSAVPIATSVAVGVARSAGG